MQPILALGLKRVTRGLTALAAAARPAPDPNRRAGRPGYPSAPAIISNVWLKVDRDRFPC